MILINWFWDVTMQRTRSAVTRPCRESNPGITVWTAMGNVAIVAEHPPESLTDVGVTVGTAVAVGCGPLSGRHSDHLKDRSAVLKPLVAIVRESLSF